MFERFRRRRVENELSDADLHRAALAGSEDAMATLYRRHGGLVYRFTLRMSRDTALAEEITQEVFLAMLSDMARFDAGRGALSTWLCGIARNQLWKHLDRGGNRDAVSDPLDEEGAPELESLDDGPAELLLRQEAVTLVRAGLDGLPDALREVVVLCALEEMSYENAAQVLGVPVGTVRSRLHRAKARLADLVRVEMASAERKRR
jgi:RNA polymerase sigma-70 factor (ECF subfamily)